MLNKRNGKLKNLKSHYLNLISHTTAIKSR